MGRHYVKHKKGNITYIMENFFFLTLILLSLCLCLILFSSSNSWLYIIFTWVPDHKTITDNEFADKIVKPISKMLSLY